MPQHLPYKRSDRVTELIHRELGNIMLRELDFNGALVTITEVEVTPKLDFARIGVSVLPDEKQDEILKLLKREQGRLQHELNHKLNIKPMPRISFELDPGSANAAVVEKVFIDEERRRTVS